MSYDISLCDPVSKETILLDDAHDMRGGTYALGGTRKARLNITWNYAPFYYDADEKGIRGIYGMTGAESISYLENMIQSIKEKHPDLEVSSDYWGAKPGNAVRPLYMLIALAKLRPDGVWDGD